MDILTDMLGDRYELIVQAQTVFDAARLSRMLGGHATISEAKIALYQKNHDDLRLLKAYVRKNVPDKYKEIFSERKDKLNNYDAYSRYPSQSGAILASRMCSVIIWGKCFPNMKEAIQS
jgi:CRISPR-associated endonuclease Csn1